MKNIHNCNITIAERMMSTVLDAHFTMNRCCGCLEAINSPVFTNDSWVQRFVCKHCGTYVTGTLVIHD